MSLRRLLVASALMGLLVSLCFLGLTLFAGLKPVAAVIGCAVIMAGHLLVLRSLLDGMASIRHSVELFVNEPEAPPPRFQSNSSLAIDLWHAILRLTRIFEQRRQQLQAELAGSNAVLAALPDPILLLNDRREVVRLNAAARELFGDKLLKRDLAVALRHPGILAATDAVLRGGEGRLIEFELTLPVDRHMRARVDPLPDHPQDGYAVLMTLTDLTTLKRAEQMRADFVANASHELRTPLSTLIGFIETLQGPAADDTEAQRRFLPIMQQQASRMARLVDDLLSLSRIELNEHLPPTGQVDLVTLLKTVAQALELKAAARQMRIELVLEPPPPPAQGDSEELAQVFQNLIDNALKYARPGSAVTLTARASTKLSKGYAISVRDCSDGIARRHLPRLTERFYRVDTARSREMGGTGLGLAIVKHIINRHRGILDIESEIGVGSVFTVHLRAASASRQIAPSATALPLNQAGA